MRQAFCSLVLALFLFSFPAMSQVTFYQPLTFNGCSSFVADFNDDGKPDLLCSDGTLNLGNGDGTFTAGTSVPGTVLAVADFNGDGKPDLLEQGTGTLLVLLGNGDGTFQTPISTASGAALSVVAAGDLNGDGKADAVGVFNNLLEVYISNGDGTFKPGVSYNFGATPPFSPVLSLADFNADGKLDIVVSTAGSGIGGTGSQEVAFLGNGDGTFPNPKISTGVFMPEFSAVGDFNGDGVPDLALSGGGCPTCQTSILLGNGDGSFQAPVVAFHFTGPLATADFNGDGKLDLVFQSDPTVAEIYLGNGDGTFSNTNSYTQLSNAGGGLTIAIADFNMDGKPDVAFANAILLGNGDGTFQGVQLGIAPGYTYQAFVSGDFERDGVLDVAQVSDTNVYIFRNDGSGALSLLNTYTLQQQGVSIVAADFNGDGNLDLAVLQTYITSGGETNWAYSMLLGNGDGSFKSPNYYPQNSSALLYPLTLDAADFNKDQKPDLAIVGLDNQSVGVLLGKGDGTFAAPAYYYNAGSGSALIADFNGDGNLDIASPPAPHATNYSTGILYGNGDGTFQALVFPASLNNFNALFTADFNNDGKPDLLGSVMALGNGDGTFTLLSTPIAAYGIADFNGDSKLDLLVAGGVALGNGDGTFGPTIPVQDTGRVMLFGDMNNDGHIDMVFAWPGTSGNLDGVGVLLNTSSGFAISATVPLPSLLPPGGSVTSTVISVPTPGFNGVVTLSCAGLPTGATCAFTPDSIARGAGNSQLTIATTAAIVPGSYKIQVLGTTGSTVNGAAVTVVVQVPDFAMSPVSGSRTSQTVSAGQTANFSLSLAGSGTFTGTVNLSCAVTPTVTAGPTCTLSSASEQISGTTAQSVTVKVGTTAPTTSAMLSSIGLPPGQLAFAWTLISTMMLAGFSWVSLRNRKRVPILVVPMVMLVILTWVACGGSGSSTSHTTPGTPVGTYTATVTATSGSLTNTTALKVTVQ